MRWQCLGASVCLLTRARWGGKGWSRSSSHRQRQPKRSGATAAKRPRARARASLLHAGRAELAVNAFASIDRCLVRLSRGASARR